MFTGIARERFLANRRAHKTITRITYDESAPYDRGTGAEDAAAAIRSAGKTWNNEQQGNSRVHRERHPGSRAGHHAETQGKAIPGIQEAPEEE